MTNDLAGSGDTPYAAITLAMQAYFRKVNAEDDGVCGRDLVLATEDDGYSPALALEKTKLLVEQTGVLAMVGGLGTEAQQGVAAYLNDPNADGDTADGVPDLFVSSSWSGWADVARYPWTIGYIPDYFTDGVVLGRYVSEKLAGKKVGIIYSDDAMGKDYLAGLEAGLTDKTLLVAKYAFPLDAANLVDQITRTKTDGAEVVLIAATPDMTALAITEAETQQFAPRWLLSYTNAPSNLASRLGGGTTADQLARWIPEAGRRGVDSVPAEPRRGRGRRRSGGAHTHPADVPGASGQQPHGVRTVAGRADRRDAWPELR